MEKQYEILFMDRHVEIVDYETVDKIIDELEMFERTDVCQIHELENDGTLGETIWTEEEGLFVRDFGFDDEYDDEDDDEFYEDGSELFMEDYSNIIGVIDDILEDLDLTNTEEKVLFDKLNIVKSDENILKEIKEYCIDRVCDSKVICDYITEYTISELGDMDGIWNEFGDILRDSIYEYFEF
jgi:hypothetical protein